MSQHTKFTDEANVSHENALDLSPEDEFSRPGYVLEQGEKSQHSRSTNPTNNSTVPLSPLQCTAISDSLNVSSTPREWQGNSLKEPAPGPCYVQPSVGTTSQNNIQIPAREHDSGCVSGNAIYHESENSFLESNVEPVCGPTYMQSKVETTFQNNLHLSTTEHDHLKSLQVASHHSPDVIDETLSYPFTSREQRGYTNIGNVARSQTQVSGDTIPQGSENSFPVSVTELVTGPSYIHNWIDTTPQNYLYLPGIQHDYQQNLIVLRHHPQSLPTVETPSGPFTSQQQQVNWHVQPVGGSFYGYISGNTLPQGPFFVQVGIDTTAAEVENPVPTSVSFNSQNLLSEDRTFTNEIDINANQSFVTKGHEDIFCNENPIPDSIRRPITDDVSMTQNAADPFRMLHIQKSHLGESTIADLNAESYGHITVSDASTQTSNLTFLDEDCHNRNFHSLPRNPTSRDSGISSEIDLSMSSTVSTKVASDSCVTSISTLKDNLAEINPSPTVSLKEIHCNKVHGVSEIIQNSVSDVRKPTEAGTKQINNDCPTLPYSVISSDSGSFGAVKKNESGGLSVHGLNNSMTLTENGNLMQPESFQGKESAFICQICRKIFNQKSELRNHEISHTTEKPFKCCVCEKTFCELWRLRRHHKVHTGEGPFKCDECEKCFTREQDLEKHKRIHTAERPYKCNVCNKSFAHSGNLTRHKRIHDGEKPFICDVCKKGFIRKDGLLSHEKTHTEKKPIAFVIIPSLIMKNWPSTR